MHGENPGLCRLLHPGAAHWYGIFTYIPLKLRNLKENFTKTHANKTLPPLELYRLVPMKRYFSRQKAIFVLTEKDRLKPTTKSRKKNFWSKGSYNRLELCDLPDFCTCLFSDSRACALRRNYMWRHKRSFNTAVMATNANLGANLRDLEENDGESVLIPAIPNAVPYQYEPSNACITGWNRFWSLKW